MPKLTTITLDLAQGTAGQSGTVPFDLVDLSENSIVRKAPGATADEGYTMNADQRLLKNGVRQYRLRTAIGVVEGTGESRVLGTVSANLTLQFPSFATAVQVAKMIALIQAFLVDEQAADAISALAVGGILP